jgi:hypothetical protein
MAELVDHLAELTGFRDRELLDVTLVGVLRDLLQPAPQSVAIFRSVGEPGNERWLTRARQRAGDVAASADPSWVDIDTLPVHAAYPSRLEAFRRQATVAVAGGAAHSTLFPVSTDRESPACWRSRARPRWMSATGAWCCRSCASTTTSRACSTTANATR